MDFKVRKGLETPLKIHGMISNYFFMYSAIGGVLGLLLFTKFLGLISGKTSFFSFGLTAIVSALIFFAVRAFFIKKSNTKKMNFGRQVTFISNRDLLKSIK